MKYPIVVTLVILAAGSFWGMREHQKLTILREKQRLVVQEAAALGVPADVSKPFVSTKVTKRSRGDAELKVKDLTERLVAFAREMKDMQTSGKQPDEAMQKRIMEMMDAMLSLNGEELKLLIAGVKDRKDMDDEMKNGMITFSIMMLAQQHPEAALALFTESSDLLGEGFASKHALSSALTQWAKDQPLEALKWIKENAERHPELVTNDTKAAVIAGAAQKDFSLALQLISELKVSVDQGSVMSQISRAAITPEQQSDLLKALRKQAETMDPKEGGKLLSAGLKSLFGQVTESGYENTMDWLKASNLSAAETGDMAEGLHYYKTRADTGKWLDWLSSQTIDGDQSKNVTRNLIREWTDQDYKAAGEWLAEAPAGPVKESATRSYLETIAPYEPEVAAQWAETLPSKQRKSGLMHIYQSLKEKDETAAADFAARHGVDVKP